MDVFDLVAKITLDSSEYDKGLGEAGNNAQTFGSKLKGGLATAGKVAGASIAAVATAATAMTGAIAAGVAKTAEYGDNIDKMSQKMGMTAEAYQEWDFVMQHAGTSIDSMQASMKTLASAAETGKDAFDALGISQEEIASMSQEELFASTITALQNVDDETQRTYLAGQLLGRGATELGALLNMTAEETADMKQQVHDLGGVMSDEAVASAAAYQDSLQNMQTAFTGLSNGLLADFLPSITTVMDGLAAVFSGDSDAGIAMISDGIDNVVNTISEKLPAFLDLGMGILSSLVQALIDNLPKILESGGRIIGELVAGLIRAIPQIVTQIPQIIMAIVEGLASAWPDIKEAGVELINMLGEGLSSMFSSLLAKGAEIVGKIKDGVMSAINGAKQWGKDLIDNFIGGIKEKWENLKSTISNVAGTIKDFLGFSEPEKGPLSNFHTFAPDMMDLFAKGIRDNTDVVTDQIEKSFNFAPVIKDAAAPVSIGALGGGLGDVLDVLTTYLPQLANRPIVFEDGTVAARMDAVLGDRYEFAEKGLAV